MTHSGAAPESRPSGNNALAGGAGNAIPLLGAILTDPDAINLIF